MKVAIIPARGGSKRIPRKNIKLFCGKPMIAWSIEAAISSKLFDHVIVSTDDDEISIVAKKYGAEVPFVRPLELSDDFTGTGAVVKHATEWVIANWGKPELICTLYATAPFVRPIDLKTGLDALLENNSQIAFTVTSYPFPIQRAIKITKGGRVEMFQPEHFSTRSQDLVKAYHDAGQLYWARRDAVLSDLSAFSEDAVPIILPTYRVQDIDTMDDWVRAEALYEIIEMVDKDAES